MEENHKPGKRIVSKGRYVVNVGEKAALSTVGAVSLLCGIFSAGVACMIVLAMLGGVNVNGIGLLSVALFGGSAWALWRKGKRAVKEAHDMQTGIPLTHATTGELPAEESLVRAAQEPTSHQQATLLRAVVPTQETHEAQLVRPAQDATQTVRTTGRGASS